MIEIVKAIWDKKAEDAKGDAQYQPSQEEVFKMIREAASITNRSVQLPGNSAPHPPALQAKSVAFGTGSGQSQGCDQKSEAVHVNDNLGPDGPDTGSPTVTPTVDPSGTTYDIFDWSTFDENNPQHVAQFDQLFANSAYHEIGGMGSLN